MGISRGFGSLYNLVKSLFYWLLWCSTVIPNLWNINTANSMLTDTVCKLKVPISPKYFFCLNKSLHLFEMHCAFLPLLNPNIDLLQAVKVTKSGHHLSHDRASKGYGSTPCLTSQTSLHACLQRLNMLQIRLWHQTTNRPMPLTSSVAWQMMARFCNFYNVQKSQDLV